MAVSNAAPAFSPDGGTVYFSATPAGAKCCTLMVSRQAQGHWSAPKAASFSGHFRDLEAAFSPSGKFLVFASNRPDRPGGALMDGHYNGQDYPGNGGHLWRIARRGAGWASPEPLPASINANQSVFSPALTADSSLYFMRADDGIHFHIFRSQFAHGHYQTPVLASFSKTPYGDFDPAVAPDESYLIFSSGRPPAPKTSDLFIIFRTGGAWSEPLDLRTAISPDVHGVEARLSPDGNTLYFEHATDAAHPNAGTAIFRVSIQAVLAAHGRR
ncbi:MAG TPA: hypothetical protein VN515_06380 [Terriglobales bacterium]|nr:hypothetical protein [Terriglobales bacterium]